MTLKKIEAELRKAALAYPETYEESPWGDRVVKVNNKIFFFVGVHKGKLHTTTKLPDSSAVALAFPFATPTHYGMGKHGWVTCSFAPEDDVPVGLILEWLDESYRAIAPKKLVKALESGNTQTDKPSHPKTKKKKKGAPILVVGDDTLRIERAKKELEGRGLNAEAAPCGDEVFERASKKPPRAIVIDLGRRPAVGLELGVTLSQADLGGAPLVFAGVRDAATVRQVKKSVPKVAGCFKEAPGDPRVLDAVSDLLG